MLKPTDKACSFTCMLALTSTLIRQLHDWGYQRDQRVPSPIELARFANADRSKIIVVYHSGTVLCQGPAWRNAAEQLAGLVEVPVEPCNRVNCGMLA